MKTIFLLLVRSLPPAGLATNMSYLSLSLTDPHLIHGDVGLLRVVWADSGELEELWDVEEDGVENHRHHKVTGTELVPGVREVLWWL